MRIELRLDGEKRMVDVLRTQLVGVTLQQQLSSPECSSVLRKRKPRIRGAASVASGEVSDSRKNMALQTPRKRQGVEDEAVINVVAVDSRDESLVASSDVKSAAKPARLPVRQLPTRRLMEKAERRRQQGQVSAFRSNESRTSRRHSIRPPKPLSHGQHFESQICTRGLGGKTVLI